MITVYFLETQYNYMGWSDMFLELVIELKNNFNAKIIHQKGGHLYIEKFDYNLPDCEILIHDEENDILRGITWAEWKTGLFDIFMNRNNPNDILLQTQFYNWFPKDFDRSTLPFKLKGTTFYTFTPQTNHDFFYHLRQFTNHEDLIDKIFFLFTTHRDDGIVLRELGLCSESPGLLNIEDYLKLAIKHKVGLSLPSVAEICYREIEYMAIGLPMLRLEFMTQLDPPLIPNYHYIAIPRDNFPWDANFDRAGGEKYVEAYKNKFLEVKDNKEFLDFISKNAREYYNNYCSPQNKLKVLMKSLEF